MTKLTKTSAQLVEEARARIEEIEAEALIAAAGDPDTVIVDIRDVRELSRAGRIPGAVHAPRGMLEFWIDPDSPYYREVFGQDGKRYVLHCASGWRSALAAAALNDMGFACAHLRGGFSAWKDAGGPVEDA